MRSANGHSTAAVNRRVYREPPTGFGHPGKQLVRARSRSWARRHPFRGHPNATLGSDQRYGGGLLRDARRSQCDPHDSAGTPSMSKPCVACCSSGLAAVMTIDELTSDDRRLARAQHAMSEIVLG